VPIVKAVQARHSVADMVVVADAGMLSADNLKELDEANLRVIVGSMVTECVTGHMGLVRINSLEAGIILIADGSDMEKGRARIPMMISTEAKVGDIHKYSSSAIERIDIEKGDERPIKITVHMSTNVGFFQVEEVLFPKLMMSPIKPYIELNAGVIGEPMKKYLYARASRSRMRI
jgi:metal-dependent HD superfamily phosphatase/phosphodiesterase